MNRCSYESCEDDDEEMDYPEDLDDQLSTEIEMRSDEQWYNQNNYKIRFDYVLRYGVHCCLCQEKGFGLCYADTVEPVVINFNKITLQMLYDIGMQEGEPIEEGIILGGPCDDPEHAVCVTCLRRTIQGIAEHTVLKNNTLPCLHPFGDACPKTYEWYNFDRILSFDEYTGLLRHLRRNSGMLPCPTCKGLIHVREDRMLPGYNIVRCHMTMACNPFCSDCGRILLPEEHCEACLLHTESNHPEAYNMYLVDHDTARFPFRRNKDWTAEEIIERITDIMSWDRNRSKCAYCKVPTEKTVACNALKHCNVERCNICGRCAMPGKNLGSVHWEKCPRFDEDWEKVLGTAHPCDASCHSHEAACDNPAHASGLAVITKKCKSIKIGKILQSIPEETRTLVTQRLPQKALR